MILQEGCAEEDYFELNSHWPLNELWEKTLKGNNKSFISSTEMDSTLMKDEKKILLCTSYYSEMYMPNYPCNIRRLGGSYMKGTTNALGFAPDSPYHHLFSRILVKMHNFGTWDIISTRMEEYRESVPCSTYNDGLLVVGYENTLSVFIVLGVSLLLAIMYSLLEKVYYHFMIGMSDPLPPNTITLENAMWLKKESTIHKKIKREKSE